MESPLVNQRHKCSISDSDEFAEQLFNNIEMSEAEHVVHKRKQKQQLSEHISDHQDSCQVVSGNENGMKTPKKLLKKLKKFEKKKKHGKKNKLKKLKKLKGGTNEELSPFEFSESESDRELSEESILLQRLNPSNKKSSVKKRKMIEKQQGFRLNELGNEGQVQLSEGEESSFVRRKGKVDKDKDKKKEKKPRISNEQVLAQLQQAGCVESDHANSEELNLDELNNLQGKKKTKEKGIKISNRMFENLSIDLNQQEAQAQPQIENMNLELEPRNSMITSKNSSFLSRAENIKRMRGLEADVDEETYTKVLQEKAKKSLAKLVTNLGEEEAEQFDVEVRRPIFAKGKSAELINNTVFLKRVVSKEEIPETAFYPVERVVDKKKELNRMEFFKQIEHEAKNRRWRQFSHQAIKQSFKKTDLAELQEIRKRIEEKKKKDLAGENSEDDSYNQELERLHENLDEEQFLEPVDLEEDPAEQQNEDSQQIQEPQLEEGQSEKAQSEEEHISEPIESIQLNQDKSENHLESNKNENQLIQEVPEHSQQLEKDDNELNQRQQHDMDIQSQNEDSKEESDQNVDIYDDAEANSAARKVNQDQHKEQASNNQMLIELKELADQGIMLTNKRHLNFQEKQQKSIRQEIQQNSEKQNIQKIENSQPEKTVAVAVEKTAQIELKQFRKLRKIATIIADRKKEKEKKLKEAQNFFENEAELGSDNEDHDEEVKKIDYEAENKEYEGIDMDADLEELIDNAVDIYQEDQEQAFRKYMEDVKAKDKEELQRILRGDFKRRSDNEEVEFQVEEDERNRQERMQEIMSWIQKREDQDQALYVQPQCEKVVENEKDQMHQMYNYEEEERKLEDCLADTISNAKKESKPMTTFDNLKLPESIKRERSDNLLQRSSAFMGSTSNFNRSKQGPRNEEVKRKIKKTSSHLNELIAKSKPKMSSSGYQKTLFRPHK